MPNISMHSVSIMTVHSPHLQLGRFKSYRNKLYNNIKYIIKLFCNISYELLDAADQASSVFDNN
jgi:hypothetical protein